MRAGEPGWEWHRAQAAWLTMGWGDMVLVLVSITPPLSSSAAFPLLSPAPHSSGWPRS